MEVENSEEVLDRKRPNSDTDEDSDIESAKKVRLEFSASNMRKLINSDQQILALQTFLDALKRENKNEYILAYLQDGGSPLEILQISELNPSISPLLVLEVVNVILLQINAKFKFKYGKAANEACRYFVNTYSTLINKMLGLSSSMSERLVALRILTTVVTLSTLLAKDILLHVNFHQPNIELLTKATEGKFQVRDAFIHFLTAFLVDGHYPTLSVLLEKKGLLTSVISGLKFDQMDTVILVITAMKNHILENKSVSKTLKMRTFSTPVVRDIVNLYNWKGPGALHDPKKKNKTIMVVDEVDKLKVNEAVHAFLLVLCTSHRYGVIFKDPSLGLGKRSQNNLMFTVLESLERPWEHSYAGELVTKICGACPDLIKTMWNNMKSFVEPRMTVRWLNAMKFAEDLLEQLQNPDDIELCLRDLTTSQFIQVISNFTMPLAIINRIIPEDKTYTHQAMKQKVLWLLLKMTRTITSYLAMAKSCKHVDYPILTSAISKQIHRTFPDCKFILNDWDRVDELENETNFKPTISDYLETSFDLLQQYKFLAPELLDSVSSIFDIKSFLTKSDLNDPKMQELRVKAVRFFLDLEPTLFVPKTELFEVVLTCSLEHYYLSRDETTLTVVNGVLKKSGVFDGFEVEIDVWIDAVLNLKEFDGNVAKFVIEIIRKADVNASDYNRKLFEMDNTNFSPVILAMIAYCEETPLSKALKTYISFVILNVFHMQIDSSSFRLILSNVDFLSKDLKGYIENWANSQPTVLDKKCKGTLFEHFHQFSNDFLEGKIIEIPNSYPNLRLNLSQTAVFYFTNLVKFGTIVPKHYENCVNFVKLLISENTFTDERFYKVFLTNNHFINHLTLSDPDDYSTKFLIEFVKLVKVFHVEKYLLDFRTRIVSILGKIFRKPQKYENQIISVEILETFELDYTQCVKLIEKCLQFEENRVFFHVLGYSLERIAFLTEGNYSLKPLDGEIVLKITHFLGILISEQPLNVHSLSASLHHYLRNFPHNIEAVDNNLIEKLLTMSEFHKDNLALCQLLLERKPNAMDCFEKHIEEICTKRSFVLTLLETIIKKNSPKILETIYERFENQILKALEKPHKAGQQFHHNYKSVGVLIEKFMKPNLGKNVQKFETVELFHVYLLEKAYEKIEKTDKIANNMTITFLHLITNLLKQKSSKPVSNLVEIGCIVSKIFTEVNAKFDLSALGQNETYKLFCKLCLKFGVGDESVLLEILEKSLCFLNENEAPLLLEMFLSHSQFLDVALGNHTDNKTYLFKLWLGLISKFPQLIERNHVPILLSSYKASQRESDESILKLLKLYESKTEQSQFNDFKPYLWGRAAASYYSIRSDIQKVLYRQPKMGDVLENLHNSTIISTITNPSSPDSYDLDFLLPLFSHLLAPESPVQTYRFTRSGALALTITGLRGPKPQRFAACHVLSRFYFHLEGKRSGKDNLLWLRFVEVLCHGISVLDDFQLNNFSGIYLAKSALILAQPTDVMYVPISQYLSAKDSLDFDTVPELYTFLHSSDVHAKEHKHFILEIIRDGLKTEKDFTIFMKSMGFKLISELCSSSIADLDTKLLILDIFKVACTIPLAIKVLCGNMSFLAQVFGLFMAYSNSTDICSNLLEILLVIINYDADKHRNFIVYLNLMRISENEGFRQLKEETLDMYFKILVIIVERFPDLLTGEDLKRLLLLSDNQFCQYLVLHGCQYVEVNDLCINLQLLVYKKLK